MKKMRWSSRSKRKSVNNDKASVKSSSRSGSRLGNGRLLFENRSANKLIDSDIHSISNDGSNNNGTAGNTPSFARGHPYSSIKKNERVNKASSAYIEGVRKSMDSQTYDDVSEYSHGDNDTTSVLSNEEPINNPVSPNAAAFSNEDTIANLSKAIQTTGIKEDSINESEDKQEEEEDSATMNDGTSLEIARDTPPPASQSAAASPNGASKSQSPPPPTTNSVQSPGTPTSPNSHLFTHLNPQPSSNQYLLPTPKLAKDKEPDSKSTYSSTTTDDLATLVSKSTAASSSKATQKKLTASNYDSSVFKVGWINKGNANMTSWSSSVTQDTWRMYRAELKGPNLCLYRPRSDLGIKSFEPSPELPSNASSILNNQAASVAVASAAMLQQITNGSALSPVPTITEADTPDSSQQENDHLAKEADFDEAGPGQLANSASINTLSRPAVPVNTEVAYVSEVYPHPELQFEENQTVSNGSLESICHTVLFNTSEDNRLSSQLISVIPLFGDTKIAIGYFVQYAIIFMSDESFSRFKEKAGHFRTPLAPSDFTKKNIVISEATDNIITNRLALVVSIIQEQFPGMLLDQVIFEKLLKLLELISVHNEQLSQDLNNRVIGKQQKMTELLFFENKPSRNLTKDETVLTADRFLKMNLQDFSNQVNLVDLQFNREWNPKTDASLLYETGYSYSRYNPLIFDPIYNIHYLGRVLVNHLFEDEESKRNIHFRAKVIQKWVELGSVFDKKGDMVSWLAIATIICSVPILRLKKTWSVVDSKTLKIVSTEWGQVVFELDRRNMTSDTAHKSLYHVIAPQGIGESYSKYRVVPYFGDLTVKLASNITLKQCEKRVQRVKISFNRWDEYLALVKETQDFGDLPQPVASIQRLLYNLLSIHVSLPRLKLDDVMALSLGIEPSTGTSLHQYYSESDSNRPPITVGNYFPILFTDILSSYRLFDKAALVDIATGTSTRRSNDKLVGVTGVDALDLLTVQDHKKLKASSTLGESVNDLLNIDCDLFHVGDDLVFKAVSTVAPEVLEDDRPIVVNVAAKSSSFEKLIDILVLTPNIFNQHIDPDDIANYLAKHNLPSNKNIKLEMDISLYTETFLACYKSFSNLTTLIEGLGRRFVGAKSAAVSIKKMKESRSELENRRFPDWDLVIDSSSPEINWKYVAQIEAGILEALYALISDFYGDFTDELQTKQCFVDILKIVDQEITNEWKIVLKQLSDGQDELFELYDNLQLLYKKIRKFYIKRSYRPLDNYLTPHTFSSVIDFPPEYAYIPGLSQFIDIQNLIEKLDIIIFDLFKQTTVSDWMTVLDLFEMQSTRSLVGIFSYKQPSPAISEEDLKFFNVFTWLESLFVENLDVKILSKFPSSIRALYGLHGKITSYFLNQIIEPRLQLNKRRNRMTSILQMLAIIKCRMKKLSIYTSSATSIPAFLESCIAMAVCAPESRWFVNDWIYSSIKLQTKDNLVKWDNLDDLVPEFDSKILIKDYSSPLTPCFGWFSERLLEVGCYIPNLSIENPLLLNFDKRRYVYRLITNVINLKQDSQKYSKEDVADIKKKFEFLYNIKRSVYDLRDIREAARKENKDYSRNEQKNKLFSQLVDEEFEKLKRDVKKKEFLELQERLYNRVQPSSLPPRQRQSPQEEYKAREEKQLQAPTPVAVSSSSASIHSSANHKSGGRFRGFLKSVRPFSINVSNSWAAQERVVGLHELPDVNFADKVKPSLQLKVYNLKPLIIHSSDIEGFFKLIGSDGQEYCFQAVNDIEAQDWVNHVNEARRYSYLSKESRDQYGSKVFGVPILDVCEREGKLVPYVVDRLLTEIESRGLNEVGLYRVPGAIANIQSLKQKFDESSEVNLDDHRWLEINTLAGCFKLYLRELPESLLTTELLPLFINATKTDNVVENVSDLISQLPFYNYHLLKRIVEHLNHVTENSNKNRMDASNLAMVFSMSFLTSSDNDFARSLGSLQLILHMMIQEPVGFFRKPT